MSLNKTLLILAVFILARAAERELQQSHYGAAICSALGAVLGMALAIWSPL